MRRMIWMVRMVRNGFEGLILISGTEEEMQEYTRSELGHTPAYRGATDVEVAALRAMGVKVYLAPEIRR